MTVCMAPLVWRWVVRTWCYTGIRGPSAVRNPLFGGANVSITETLVYVSVHVKCELLFRMSFADITHRG